MHKTTALPLIALAAGVCFLQCIPRSSPTSVDSYGWVVDCDFAFQSSNVAWMPTIQEEFDRITPYLQWLDTTGSGAGISGGSACATGMARAIVPVRGYSYNTTKVRFSAGFRFSQPDSNFASVMFVDSQNTVIHRLSLGRDTSGAVAPGLLTLSSTIIGKSRKVFAYTQQIVPNVAADEPFQLVFTSGDATMRGELQRAGSAPVIIGIDTSTTGFTGITYLGYPLYQGFELRGSPAAPVCADRYLAETYTSSDQTYDWRWSDPTLVARNTAASATGRVTGTPFLPAGMPVTFLDNENRRVSLTVMLSSVNDNSAAVTITDSVAGRTYWLVLGYNGLTPTAPGALSVVITDAKTGAVIAGTNQPVPGLLTGRDYLIAMNLEGSTVRGAVHDPTTSLLAEVEVPTGSPPAISTGSMNALHPCVELIGTPSAPVTASAFQGQAYRVVSTYTEGGGGGGSCPFINTYDGKRFHRESETFAGALFRMAERTEYDRLYKLQPIDGKLMLRVSNELPEKHFINEVGLLAVDAPVGTSVLLDFHGAPHSLTKPIPARRCVDRAGNDVLSAVSSRDSAWWTSDMTFRDFSDPAQGRDGVVMTFDKPAGAQTMKLVVDGINTYLGFYTALTLFQYLGEDRTAMYRRLEENVAVQKRLLEKMHTRGGLHLYCRVNGSWVERGVLRDVGPLVQKAQVAIIDIKDIPADTVEIMLECATDLWRIDRVYADFSDDAALKITELPLRLAFDNRGRSIEDLVHARDSRYYTNTMGEYATLIFNDAMRIDGAERTYFVKATGYYHNFLGIPNERRQLALRSPLFVPSLNGKRFYDSWMKVRDRYGRT